MSLPLVSAPLRVGLVLDRGGKDDKSFNSSAYEGASEAKKKLGIFLKYVESPDDNAYESLCAPFRNGTLTFVIGIGFAHEGGGRQGGGAVPQDALRHCRFRRGSARTSARCSSRSRRARISWAAIAALTSKTAKVGFVGGMDIPLIRRFEMGYEAGAKQANPQATVLANYVGVNPSEAWNNSAQGQGTCDRAI